MTEKYVIEWIETIWGRLQLLEAAIGDPYHYVEFREEGWGMEHPVGCRTKTIFQCDIYDALVEQMNKVTKPPVPPGKYLVSMIKTSEPDPAFVFSPATAWKPYGT